MKLTYKVLRPHQGEKWYDEGDDREADERDVAHLVSSGVLAKAEPMVANKSEPRAANKGKRK